MNWENGNIYSTVVNTYNPRDQVTKTTEWAGAEGAGALQDTITDYDGYGRLWKRHAPEQTSRTSTVYEYFNDDRIKKVTDARGASTTYGYDGTNRHGCVWWLTTTASGMNDLGLRAIRLRVRRTRTGLPRYQTGPSVR